MSEDERKEDIRRRLSGKTKKVDDEVEVVELEVVELDDEAPVVELTPEEILEKEGWVRYYTRGMAAVLKCEKCGNDLFDERRKTVNVGDKIYLYCRKCNMSYHHECIGYSIFAKKP